MTPVLLAHRANSPESGESEIWEGKVEGEKRKRDPYIIFNCFECLKKNCWQMFDKSVDVFGKQIIDVYVEK